MAVKSKEEPLLKEEVWVPTGSTVADLVVGAGRGEGFEAGQIVNLCALSGGGKTAFANETIANSYQTYGKNLKWVYDQTSENGNTFDTKRLYGISIIPENPDEVVQSSSIEEAFANILVFLSELKPHQRGIYVLDSLDALSSKEIDDMTEERVKAHKNEKDYDKGSYQGGKSKFLSTTFFPKIAAEAEKKNCLIIVISQLRDNIGGGLYAPKDKVSNGRALLYYCSSQVWLKPKRDIIKGDLQIGSVMHITTKKARGPNPYREGMFTFYYTYGIDNIGSNIDFLYDLLTPERGELKKTEAKTLDWDGNIMSRDELILYIEKNKLASTLADRVRAKWNKREQDAVEDLAGRQARFM